MRNILIVCFLLFGIAARAQITPDNLPTPPSDYSISGTVNDSATGQALEYATVTLLKARDSSVVNGAITAHNGYFLIDNLKPGLYLIKISFLGYKDYKMPPVKLLPTQPTLSFKIRLSSNSKNLKEVTISGLKDTYTQEVDKKVYDVTKDITAQGGTAVDVLQNVPSVTQDVSGNINLRGSDNVTILIDGKPSSMLGSDANTTLQNIPANAIDKIEVITNPSAKYDAAGMAGIINIVTKKNMLNGFNGNITAGIGDGGKHNAGGNINYRSKLFNVFGNYSYLYNTRYGYGSSLLAQPHGDSISYVNENGVQSTVTQTNIAKAGIDFFPTQLTTISFASVYNNSQFTTDQTTQYQFITSTTSGTTFTNGILRQIDNPANNFGWDHNLSFKQDFLKPKEELTADLQYSINHNNPQNTFTDYELSSELIPLDSTPAIQTNSSPEVIKQYYAQADYVLPVTKTNSIEAGVKYNDQVVNNEFFAQDLTDVTDIFTTSLSLMSQNFNFNQAVSAAYLTYNTSFHTIDIKAGLRAENTNVNFTQLTGGENFTDNYTNLFPSLFLSKQITEATQVQLSYSRRINRPTLNDLDPVPNYSDPTNIREGNPFLKPELQNSFELSGLQYLRNSLFSLTFYFHESNNTIQRFKTVDTTGTGIISFINLDNSYSYGVEGLVKTNITRWWDITGSINAYGNQLDGSAADAGIVTNQLICNVKLSCMLKFSNTFTGMIQGYYQSPQNTILGHLDYFSSVTAGLKKEFLKKKLSANLACSDIFNTRHFEAELIGDDFTQSVFRKNESRIATLTLTYLFGRGDNNNNKQKQQQQNQQQTPQPSEEF
jgi:iron complex outermembrane recepter protein